MTLIYASFSTKHTHRYMFKCRINRGKKKRVLILLLFNVCQLLRETKRGMSAKKKKEKSEILNKVIECLFSILT